MREIFVPREIVNDESVIVISVKFASESKVSKGECLFEIETSKTVIEVDAPEDGVIHHTVSVGDELRIGSLLCKLETSKSPSPPRTDHPDVKQEEALSGSAVISKAALQRAKELGINPSEFQGRFVSAHDIERYSMEISSRSNEQRGDGLRMSNNKIVILGGGGHAKMCIDVLRLRDEYEIVGIVDPHIPVGTLVCGVKVIGDDAMLQTLWNEGVSCAVNGIGSVSNPSVRERTFQKLKRIGFFVPNLIHPSAVIEPSVKLGEGNQIMMGACVGSDAVIGNNCIINSGAVVSHDCVISNHAHVAPGAVLAGNVFVGEFAVIGMGVTVYLGLKIGAGSIVNNGMNLFRDVEAGGVVKA